MSDDSAIRSVIKRLIVDSLNLKGTAPSGIDDEQDLSGDGLGLDSVDFLELMVALEREFGISIDAAELDRRVFGSVAQLAAFVQKCAAQQSASTPHG